jgi:sialic acid synthase SpsE
MMLDRMGVPFIKVGSGDNCNLPLLRRAAATGRPLLVSTGMMNLRDLKVLHEHLVRVKACFVLLHCVSCYPAPPEQLNLRFIPELKRLFPDTHVGYSGHELGIDASIAAVAIGARVSSCSTAWSGESVSTKERYDILPTRETF